MAASPDFVLRDEYGASFEALRRADLGL